MRRKHASPDPCSNKSEYSLRVQAGRVHMPPGVYDISLLENNLVLFQSKGAGKPAGGYFVADSVRE